MAGDVAGMRAGDQWNQAAMSNFFFHVHDGTLLPDRTGIELPSLDEAYAQAIATSGQILQEAGIGILKSAPWRMEVTDGQGQLLLTLLFSAEIAPRPPAA